MKRYITDKDVLVYNWFREKNGNIYRFEIAEVKTFENFN